VRTINRGSISVDETIVIESIDEDGNTLIIRRAVNGNSFSTEKVEASELKEELKRDQYDKKKEATEAVPVSILDSRSSETDQTENLWTL
jgi:hypothetical protein